MTRGALTLLALLTLAACSPLSDARIAADLKARHPGCELRATQAWEGDDAEIHVRVNYRCKGSTAARHVDATYVKWREGWEIYREGGIEAWVAGP